MSDDACYLRSRQDWRAAHTLGLFLTCLLAACGGRSALETGPFGDSTGGHPDEAVEAACVYGFADCDADRENGCETEIMQSDAHCGGCEVVCGADRMCLAGRCLRDGDVASVTAGVSFTCALRVPGEVWCWGRNDFGNLGRGYVSEVEHLPARVEGLENIVQVSAGTRMMCALNRAGEIWCWGKGKGDALGNDSSTDQHTPVLAYDIPDVALLRNWGLGALVLQRAGTIRGWGRNYVGGALGSGESQPGVNQTAGIADAVYLSAWGASCAVTTSRKAYCWGHNEDGEVGPFRDRRFTTPVELDLPPMQRVDPGYARTCATLRDGRAMCWGHGNSYTPVVGLNNLGEVTEPSIVPGIEGAIRTLAAFDHRCALLASGQVHCWGWFGLGRGDSSVDPLTPAPVVGLDDAVDIAVGSGHTCAVRASGKLVCWGADNYGQLGNEGRRDATTPFEVFGEE